MNQLRLAFRATFIVAITLVFTALACAQATPSTLPTLTWVSGVGDDANPGSRTAPCKTFAGAISRTAAGGEIDVIDSGRFGPVTITKSITIDGTGMMASILAGGGTSGININITDAVSTAKGEKPDPAKAVRIRGLSINGASVGVPGVHGIRVIAANTVIVLDTIIDGFSMNAINIEATNATQVFVKNTTLSHNAGSGINVADGKSQVGMSDVAVVFNGAALTAPRVSITSFNNNVLYGNVAGDSASPLAPRK